MRDTEWSNEKPPQESEQVRAIDKAMARSKDDLNNGTI